MKTTEPRYTRKGIFSVAAELWEENPRLFENNKALRDLEVRRIRYDRETDCFQVMAVSPQFRSVREASVLPFYDALLNGDQMTIIDHTPS